MGFRHSYILFLALLMISRSLFADTSEIHLEGVIYDEASPQASLAVIDGEFLKMGDRYQDYQVLKINPKSAVLKEEKTGEELILEITGAPISAPDELNIPESAIFETPQEPQTFQEKMVSLAKIPAKIFNRFWELKALRDLAIIHNGSVTYYQSRGYFPVSLKELVGANILASAYDKPKRGYYTFQIINHADPEKFGIQANPADPESGLKYFYIGVDTVIRESIGKPATVLSAPHDY